MILHSADLITFIGGPLPPKRHENKKETSYEEGRGVSGNGGDEKIMGK